MKFLDKVKKILFTPDKFFTSIKKEKGLKEAFIYYAILMLIGTILTFTIGFYISMNLFSYYMGLFSEVIGVELPAILTEQMIIQSIGYAAIGIMGVYTYLMTLIGSFVSAGILYIWILIFGGKGNYTKTYQMCVYSKTPSALLKWIPIVGGFAWLYEVYLLIKGTEKLHGLSKRRSILIFAVPIGLLVVFGLLALMMWVTLMQNSPQILAQIANASAQASMRT